MENIITTTQESAQISMKDKGDLYSLSSKKKPLCTMNILYKVKL